MAQVKDYFVEGRVVIDFSFDILAIDYQAAMEKARARVKDEFDLESIGGIVECARIEQIDAEEYED